MPCVWWPLIDGTGDVRVGMGKLEELGPVFIVKYLTCSDSSRTDCSSSRMRDYKGMLV